MEHSIPITEAFPSDLLKIFEGLLHSYTTQPNAVKHTVDSLDDSSLARREYGFPAFILDRQLARLLSDDSSAARSRLRMAAIAASCLSLPRRVAALRLPSEILCHYPRALRIIADHLTTNSDAVYPTSSCDFFIKDVRTTLALAVPCGAQYVDLRGAIRLRSLVKNAIFTRNMMPLWQLARSAIFTPWYEIHTDPRDLIDFTEQGWESCYRNIAQLLTKNPVVAGMVGTSWFYDPQLLSISPRIAYLQTTPLLGGALRIRNGPGAIHTERATSKSVTRRKLYEEGKYLPVCYTIIWPRDPLLAWAHSQS